MCVSHPPPFPSHFLMRYLSCLWFIPSTKRAMGLAFRGYVVGDAKAGSPGAAALSAGGLSGRYRLFVDPVQVRTTKLTLAMQMCLIYHHIDVIF